MIYCRFICSGQTGHTVLAHILDSHPDCIISEECFIVTKVTRRDWKLNPIVKRIEESSDQIMRTYSFYGKQERPYGSYRNKYGRLTEWNGRYRDLRVIGDKHGWDCLDRPKSTETLQRRLGIPVKTIALIRNPFDLISSIYAGHKRSKKIISEPDLNKKIDEVEKLSNNINNLINKDTYILRLEDLIEYPEKYLNRVFNFLGLKQYNPVIEAANKVLFSSPRSYRKQVPWKKKEIDRVFNIINKYDFYKGYK